uniref:G-protein coupled receptors family 2 profile 2 domain-containing protein n=2 Tax=Pectinophora gossypiella TaxID=13191 RepID=A0A1E1WCB0_PECGO
MKLKVPVLVLLVTASSVSCAPCSTVESLDISTGELFENGTVIHNGIEYPSSAWYTVVEEGREVRFGCPCIGRTCLWKCCAEGHMYFNKSCTATDMEEVNPFRPTVFKGRDPLDVAADRHFFYMYNRPCTDRYLVDTLSSRDEVFVQENGTLYEIVNNLHQWHPAPTFCVDMMITNSTLAPRLVALVCHPQETDQDDSSALYIAYAIGLMLSVPFLLATFLVYAFIPELRNLHGMCLMAYCAGLIVAYPLLAYLKMQVGDVNVEISGCMAIAFIIYYAFQSSFFWLNVMCFDIWRTFSGYRGGSSNKRRERKRFAWYGLYAWGVPLVLTSITIAMQFSNDLPSHIIRPGFGSRRCWFIDWLSELVYFFTPVLTLVVCNIVLFSITAHRIRSIRQETSILKSSESSRSDKLKRDKQRYALYLKLFVVMGVNWSVEVISFAAGGSNWYWIIIDLSNIALGVFIFFIFVWKNKVRNLVRKKFAKWRGVPMEGTGFSDSGTGRWATRSSTAPTEITRIHSSDDPGMRLKDIR